MQWSVYMTLYFLPIRLYLRVASTDEFLSLLCVFKFNTFCRQSYVTFLFDLGLLWHCLLLHFPIRVFPRLLLPMLLLIILQLFTWAEFHFWVWGAKRPGFPFPPFPFLPFPSLHFPSLPSPSLSHPSWGVPSHPLIRLGWLEERSSSPSGSGRFLVHFRREERFLWSQ